MDYESFCRHCKHYEFDQQEGVLCGLTHMSPSFEGRCENYELDPSHSRARKSFVSRRLDAEQMKGELRKWGIGLIILGVVWGVLLIVSVVWGVLLVPVWGGLIIVLGILNLAVSKRGMFIANGTALLLVAIPRIWRNSIGVWESIARSDNISEFEFSLGHYFWLIFNIVLLFWGIQQIRKFPKYAGVVSSMESSDSLEPNTLGSR